MGDHKVITFPPTYQHDSMSLLITLILIHLSTVELLITSTTINLSTTLDITIYSTRGDLSYSKSFLLDRVGIVSYMGGCPLPSSNPDSLPPPSRVLYRGIMLEIIRTLFKNFLLFFFLKIGFLFNPNNY